jgi:hypothetical protein
MRHRCRPMVWAEKVGFRWPTPERASGQRASSPRPDQGGIVKASCRPTFISGSSRLEVTPQSDFDRRRFTQSDAFANPTTPASAAADLRPSVSPASVPSPPAGGSADAGGSHVPLAPTRAPSSRWWSAYTDDDGGRSEFPLEPPSFASLWWAVRRPSIDWKDSIVTLPLTHVSRALSSPGRYM